MLLQEMQLSQNSYPIYKIAWMIRWKKLLYELYLEKINAYSFETKDDGGIGNAYRDLITFDLANMYTSNIPFVVHDADLMAPIEKLALSELIKEYDSEKKDDRQVFVSFKSY